MELKRRRRSWLLRVAALVLLCCCNANSEARSISSLEAPRGCTWRHEDEDAQTLVCRLRTMSTAVSILGNLSSLQADSVSALSLECNEALFYESQLQDSLNASSGTVTGGSFLGGLPRLERLRIEHCKIRNLPAGAFAAAPELRRLSLRSHNGDWTSIAMELHRDALRGLSELRELDLGDNNVWSLPGEFLCPSPGLATLNLTSNRLQDVASLGFVDLATACAQGLESLDLSGNDLSALPDHGLSALRGLGVLRLQDNAIAAVGDHALGGLASLRSLNVSSNRLVALPPELFAKTRELRELVLSNNSLSVLAPGLLDGLDQLQSLDLSRNELTSRWVNRDTFAKLARLVLLDLSFNALTKVDAHVFRGLAQLQLLNLEHNQIDTLADECFGALGNLRSLALSHNRIARFEAAHSVGLALLDQFFLDENRLQYVHADAFANLTGLQDLRLSGNGLSEVPTAVRALRNLKTLDLGNNKIANVNHESFAGLDKLSGLRLVDNKLENISRKAFSNMPALQILNLASNAIRHVEQGAFFKNNLLIAIRLDGNQLTEIHGVFRNLPSLLMLNISDNKLLWFNYGDLPQSLEWLDMHSNQISDLGSDFSGDGREELRIKKLDASFNRIEEISESSVPNSVEKLYLNNNRIRTIAPGTFMRKTALKKVVLYGNDMQHLDVAAVELQPVPSDRDLPMFYIGNNPILCDCTMEWLPRINELSRMRQHPRVMDLDAVTCDMVHARAAPKRPLLSLKSKDFACRYQSHCFAICHCCDFDACDCEMTCPDNCSCYHDHSWSSNVVDCSNAGYRFVPERIPMDATEIYLDGNDLGDLGSHVFIGKRKLEVLFLNNSGISGLHNRTFNGAESLRVLHLEQNALRELKGFEFDQLEQLRELYLDHNAIAAVANTTFRKMKSLEVLRLDNNRIVDFKPWEAVASREASVSLEGNSWSCDCSNAARLRAWLSEHLADAADRMYCHGGVETIAQAIERCGDPSTEAVSIGIHNPAIIGGNFVPLLAAALVVVIAVCLVIALGFAFRQDVRLWAHARYGLRLGKMSSSPPEEERDRLYDGYFVYHERDDEFISRYLAPELEQSGLALCLHWRDLPPTRSQDSLLPAASAARRIVIALSPLFLANEWQQPEFRAALRAALDTIRPASRRRRVIVLLATEIPAPDPELQLLLQTCTVIVWGDKRFWEKLRFHMPDSADSGKRPGKSAGHASSAIPARYSAAPSVVVDAWSSKPPVAPPATIPAPPSTVVQSSSGCSSAAASSVLVAPLHAPTPTPTQSTYVSSASSRTEDEDSGHEQHHHHHHHHHHHMQQQQQQQQQQLQLHNQQLAMQLEHHQTAGYSALHPELASATSQRPPSVTSRSSHLYSTIPEIVQTSPYGNAHQMPMGPRTYFV
ncbi:toll-like receptor 6 [Phymastichus coffea]|uniref:toll-like receptor 6 n=1 Tax=Phymastichus coffea TaxID=108790 RepID=UPI00273CB4D2|nr:toll-like receptor 6 [Phymastichus coffea]